MGSRLVPLEPTEENIKSLFEDKEADLIVFGHNHNSFVWINQSLF